MRRRKKKEVMMKSDSQFVWACLQKVRWESDGMMPNEG